MPTVRCTVNNCEYWGNNNFCKAESILVQAPSSPIQQANKHGELAEQLHPTPAPNMEATLCYTFEEK